MPYCVGLTGGIGSGKSSAARLFAALGAGVVDFDDISHALTRLGGVAIPAIRGRFGEAAIAGDGSLNRSRMRELVFSDAAARTDLEAILYPMIIGASRTAVTRAPQTCVVLVVPLLLERNTYGDITQRVVVVDCNEQTQIKRTTQRSAISEAAVRAIMAAQLSRRERLAGADDVINNDGDEAHLRRQVEALHARYLELAQAPRG